MESKILSERDEVLWETECKLIHCRNAIQEIARACKGDYMQRESLFLLGSMINICLSHLDLIKERNTSCLINVQNAERNQKIL